MRSPHRRLAATALAGLALLAAGCTSAVSGTPHAVASQDCAGGQVVRPSGGPYCYVVPEGFRQAAGAQAGDGQFPTDVAVDDSNQLVAAVFPAQTDLDQISDDALVQALDKLLGSDNGPSFRLTSPHGELQKVPAGRAVGYHATATANNTDQTIYIDLYLVVKGRTKVQLNCQYTDQKEKVEAGCSAVLQSLRITRPAT